MVRSIFIFYSSGSCFSFFIPPFLGISSASATLSICYSALLWGMQYNLTSQLSNFNSPTPFNNLISFSCCFGATLPLKLFPVSTFPSHYKNPLTWCLKAMVIYFYIAIFWDFQHNKHFTNWSTGGKKKNTLAKKSSSNATGCHGLNKSALGYRRQPN